MDTVAGWVPDMTPLYPLRFREIFKEKIWGGKQLARLLGKHLPPGVKVGESWELSDYRSDISIVSNGPLVGTSLRRLMQEQGRGLLGERFYTGATQRFPLLLKFIDAEDLLSVQVHPDHDYAKLHDPEEGGKCEAWLVLDATPPSRIIRGLKAGVAQKEFEGALEEGALENLLNEFSVSPGDCIYLPPGTVHGVRPELVLFEVQETSDATYRLYDWGRVGTDGKARPLHIRKALEVICFEAQDEDKTTPRALPETSGRRWELVRSRRFVMERLELSLPAVEHTRGGFFTLSVIEGRGQLSSPSGDWEKLELSKGDTVLIPAALEVVEILPTESVSLVKTFLPSNWFPLSV